MDDDRDFAESLAMALEGRGYLVVVASSGEEALQVFQKEDFDIAFMDVRLPGINGVESFLRIRKIKPAARVVMMTGYSVEGLLKQAVKNGAMGVLHKPMDVGKVLEFIKNACSGGILITDDDPDFVLSLRDLLEEEGFRVYTCGNGHQALDHIRQYGAQALILDLRMPVLDGLETYTRLREEGYAVPTIIVTAYADQEPDSIEALNLLAVERIVKKPFEPSSILRILEAIGQGDRE